MPILLDPTSERAPTQRQRLPRPKSLTGLTIGLLDIAKARGNIFLDYLEERLRAMDVTVKRYNKPTFTRPAPLSLRQTISAECHIVIEALAD